MKGELEKRINHLLDKANEDYEELYRKPASLSFIWMLG